MLTLENCIRLCDNCPNRSLEGTSEFNPATGNLIDRLPVYMNARFEFVADPSQTPDVPTGELATTFLDDEGNRTNAFVPYLRLDDIAQCIGPVVVSRYGFLGLKRQYDCGAQVDQMAELRSKIGKWDNR